jgi:hypothetical protein
MKLLPVAFCAFTLAAGAAVACSSSSDDNAAQPAPPPAQPPAPPPASDGGPTDSAVQYPAPHPSMPQVTSLGGPTLAKPVIVPVFFPGFAFRTEMLDFAKKLGPSAYWKAISSEYGVGAVTVVDAIDIPDDPGPMVYDDDIQTWLESRFDGTHPEWGNKPLDGAIYTLFYPTTTTISMNPPGFDAGVSDSGRPRGTNQSCRSFLGYHANRQIGGFGGTQISYAVIPQCKPFGGGDAGADAGLSPDAVTSTSSHEWIEAATDPYPLTTPAYATVDDDHLAWSTVVGGGEVGDMCAQDDDSFYSDPEIGYVVQRSWSNAAAKAGLRPCVPPSTTDPYFNAAPVFKDQVALAGIGNTKGVVVPVGSTKTFELELYSSAPTSGPWTVKVGTLQGVRDGGPPPAVEFTLDKNQGMNGDKIQVTVKANSATTSRLGGTAFVIDSTLGDQSSYWVGIVGN